MREETINDLISDLNTNSFKGTIFKHQISNDVDFAQVWGNRAMNISIYPVDFYLIKNKDIYVGAVYYMGNDLHWFVVPKHRGNGYLTKALTNTIMPYLFDEYEKEEQRITINESEISSSNYLKSSKVALSVGFERVNDIEYVMPLAKVNPFNDNEMQYDGLKNDEVESIKNQLNNITKNVLQIDAQINNAFGNDEVMNMSDTDLGSITSKLESYKSVVVDLYEDFKEKN